MSTNQETLGVTAYEVMKYVNPSFSPDGGFAVEKIVTGTGTGGTNTLTDSTASWSVDQWAGWHATYKGSAYEILSNTKTVNTISGTLTGTDTYYIGSNKFKLTDTELTQLIKDCVNLLIGELPEQYGNMISKISYEAIVKQAEDSQTTASLTYPYKAGTTLEIYVNPSRIPASKLDMLELTTDYTISDNQDITFVNALSADDKVYACYEHELPTVPAVLKRLALWAVVIELTRRNYIYESETLNLKLLKEDYDKLLQRLFDKGGINEFDQIALYEETKGTEARLWGSVESY